MKIHKSFSSYFLIILGFSLISIFIWLRFLRTRIPKELPFTLLVISYLLIAFSTIVYCYIIYRLFKPNKSNVIFNELNTIIMTPLKEFDNYLEQYISFTNLLLYCHSKVNQEYIFYILTNIIPRIIILSILIIDIFLFHKFFYIYKIILIAAIPLFTRYFIYSLSKIKDNKIKEYSIEIRSISTPYVMGVDLEIDDDYDDLVEFMQLSLEKFIDYQTYCVVHLNQPVEYCVYHTKESYNNYEIKFHTDDLTNHYKIIEDEAKERINKILTLSTFILRYKNATLLHKSLRNMKAFIYSGYLICWSYILFISAPHVIWMTGLVSLIHTLYMMEDPFSGKEIFTELIEYISRNNNIKDE